MDTGRFIVCTTVIFVLRNTLRVRKHVEIIAVVFEELCWHDVLE